MSAPDPFAIINKPQHFDLSHGFLPNHDPIWQLPEEFAELDSIAMQLPKLLASNQVRSIIENLPNLNINQLENPHEQERAMMLLSYIAHAYVWYNQQPVDRLPANLSGMWYDASQQVGRPPVLSYASYALYNWRRIDPEQPIELGNIALLQNFLGGIDEEWFILIHVAIEAAAIPVISALPKIQDLIPEHNISEIITLMQQVNTGLEKINSIMEQMPEHCDPYIYYNRVRPYIHGWKDNPALPNGLIYEGVSEYANKPQFFKGETGAQSTIIPALDAVYNVYHEESPLKLHLDEMRIYMPPEHRELLVVLESNPSIRDCVLENFAAEPKLRDLYNQTIELIHRFRKTHIHYAAQYIQKQNQTSSANPTEVGTGGTPFMQYLKKHVDETHDRLI